jgi:hypothetical protein
MKPGRPRGALKGTGKYKNVVVWKPIHETIVTLHVLGKKNVEIAKQLKIVPLTVGNIINSEKGQARIKELSDEHIKSIRASHEEKVEEIKTEAINNVHRLITDKKLQQEKPFAMFEVSAKALQLLDKTPTQQTNPQQANNTQINIIAGNPEFVSRLVNGLDKIEQIQSRINASN